MYFDFDRVQKTMLITEWKWYDVAFPISRESITDKLKEMCKKAYEKPDLYTESGGFRVSYNSEKQQFQIEFIVESYGCY